MSRVQDQVEFESAVTAAKCRHQQALKAAYRAFRDATDQAEARRQERLAKAQAAFDEIKSAEPEPEFEAIRRELDEALGSKPDIDRHQLSRDVEAADAELNEALAEARRKLAIAPPTRAGTYVSG